jgi:hydroxysqualene dehydroxylase
MRPRTVVVGGGLAGLTAALERAERGDAVLLLESRERLGGLAGSFRRAGPAGELEIDTGQHVFLRCCTSYRRLLARLGVAERVTLQDRLTIPVLRPGPADRPPVRALLRRSALPAPAHLAPALLRYRVLRPADRLRAVRGALALRRVAPDGPGTDDRSFGAWLAAHGQNGRTVTALWDLVGTAALNARADDASLSLAATVFRTGLLTDPAAGDIGWSRVPLQDLHGEPGRRRLEAAGCEVRTGARVTGLAADGDGWALVTRDGRRHEAEQVVLAVPPAAAERLLPVDALDHPPGWASDLGAVPIVNVHVIYDRPVMTEPLLAAVDSPVQWVFDRTAATRLTTGAQHLAVSLSAARGLLGLPSAVVRAQILPALAALFPAARGAGVLDSFVVREPGATVDPAPGQAARRPPVRTRHPGLVLAGAWTATGWPATMEGAVRSGEAAAAALDEPEAAVAAGAPSPARRTAALGVAG